MIILLVATLITFLLKEYVDSAVILAVVLVNAIIGFMQESKAIKAIEALANAMTSETTVLREGKKRRINSHDLVPGDMVLLQSGDKVPADMRLIHTKELQIDESALTGESIPVSKQNVVLESSMVIGGPPQHGLFLHSGHLRHRPGGCYGHWRSNGNRAHQRPHLVCRCSGNPSHTKNPPFLIHTSVCHSGVGRHHVRHRFFSGPESS